MEAASLFKYYRVSGCTEAHSRHHGPNVV